MAGFISDEDMAKMESKPPGFISDDEVAHIEKSNPVSQLESGLRGAAQGIGMGFADETTGGLEALWNKVKGDPRAFGDLYKQYRDESRSNYNAAEEANPITYGGGQIAGGVGSLLIPGLNVAKGAGLAATAGKAALQGGLTGIGSSEADDLSGLAKDAASGAAIGGVLGSAGHAIGAAIPKVGEALDSTAEKLAGRALGAERGTFKKLGEDKIREAGRYALDEGIVTPLASTESMAARNAATQQRAGRGMGDVYKAIDEQGASSFNPLDVAGKVDEKVGSFWRSPINRGETNQLENTLESILMRGDKNIPLTEAQTLKQELGKVANWKNTLNITDKERMARDAYGVVSGAIDDATEQGAKAIGKEALTDTLKQSKKLFGNSKTAEELLSNKQAREQGNRMFGLTDSIVGAGAFAGGPATSLAAVGTKKLAERYGMQTAAYSADKLANIVKSTPERFGKYGSVLQKAAERGGTSLGATHFVLMNSDPSYRETVKGLEGDQGN